MTSAGVSLTGNLGITGNASLTTITAKTSGDRRHFYVGSSRTLTLKWLKLTGGSQSSGSGGSIRGGSIYLDGTGSTLHATSCVIHGNTAYQYGGGVWCDHGSVQLHRSTVSGNTATIASGGGVHNRLGSVQLYHSNITGNTAYQYGGGVSNEYSGSTLIEDSIIADNTASRKGGGIYQYTGTLTITRSVIKDNRQTTGTVADLGGGGVYLEFNAVVTIRESTFENNEAEGSNKGHQIMAWKENTYGAPAVTVVNTKFDNSGVTGGEDFYLYDFNDTPNSGAAAYGSLSEKECSNTVCTVAPFTGACTDRTDDSNKGMTCACTTGSLQNWPGTATSCA